MNDILSSYPYTIIFLSSRAYRSTQSDFTAATSYSHFLVQQNAY